MSATLLDKKEERIRQMFGGIAPWYDTLNHLLSLNIDRAWRRKAVRLVPPEGNAPILDLCTGTGDLALEYHKAGKGGVPVVGADFCYPMLARAAVKSRHTPIRYVEADAQHLPFPADTFQIVTVAFGLRNVTDHERGLDEMVRVTKPGGRVAVLEFSQPTHPLFGRLYQLYFRRLLPAVGQTLSRSPDSAYRYLPASVLAFPNGEALAAKLRARGLTDVQLRPFTFGIATLYWGRKPAR